mgnify:CR=1 FL=1
MKKTLLLTSILILSGCNLHTDSDKLDGTWHLECQLENNVYSGIEGVYSFDNGMFSADMTSCDLSNGDPAMVSVSFPYSYGDYVVLGEGMEARQIKIHVDVDYNVNALIYQHREKRENDKIYWTWGFNNTSIEHSIFGFSSNDTESYWGGYLLNNIGDGKYSPIKSLSGLDINTDIDDDDFSLERPTTVSFQSFLIER